MFLMVVVFVLFFSSGPGLDPGMVRIVCGHHNWIAVAYAQFVVCYRFASSAS